MKKINIKLIIKIIFSIIIIILAINFIISIFKTHHEITYTISKEGKTFNIEETYDNNNYYLKIEDEKNTYSIETQNIFNKNKKIVKDIEYYEFDNYKCIYIPNTETNIICSDEKYNYSYEMLKDNLKEFKEQLEKKGYKFIESNEKTERIGNVNTYKNNIPNNTYIYIYKYNGVYTLNNKKLEQLNILEKENYTNTLGTAVDKYYILANYDDKYTINKFYIINMTNNSLNEIELKQGLSKDSYILGTVESKLYIFDPDNIIEYEINPNNKSILPVADKDQKGKYFNGSWQEINIYDFKTKKILFKEEYDYKIENASFIKKYNHDYYYLIDENIYQYNDITKTTTILVALTNITNIIIENNDVYFLKGNTLYMYTNGTLLKLLTYDELTFNNINRYQVYTK